jgi:hypothetical protein
MARWDVEENIEEKKNVKEDIHWRFLFILLILVGKRDRPKNYRY